MGSRSSHNEKDEAYLKEPWLYHSLFPFYFIINCYPFFSYFSVLASFSFIHELLKLFKTLSPTPKHWKLQNYYLCTQLCQSNLILQTSRLVHWFLGTTALSGNIQLSLRSIPQSFVCTDYLLQRHTRAPMFQFKPFGKPCLVERYASLSEEQIIQCKVRQKNIGPERTAHTVPLLPQAARGTRFDCPQGHPPLHTFR